MCLCDTFFGGKKCETKNKANQGQSISQIVPTAKCPASFAGKAADAKLARGGGKN